MNAPLVSDNPNDPGQGVFHGVTAYHWLVVLLASCGWLFDCMDQRIFALSREPALKEVPERRGRRYGRQVLGRLGDGGHAPGLGHRGASSSAS